MKIKLFAAALSAGLMLSTGLVFADTIVTAPIDSRPISCEYMDDLAKLAGDRVIYPSKDIMDIFPADSTQNRFADSKAVRDSIYQMTGENNKSSNAVIINTSTYFTSGLVGSRVGSCYKDIDSGLEDLKKLTTDYTNPRYYVNLTTPRSLPETRFNSIWRNDDVINGIGWYYLQRNPHCEDYDYIKSNYAKITPAQLLMEYSYVSGKLKEGVPLSNWERDFYKSTTARYMSKDPYRTYMNNYIEPFEKSVEIMKGLIELKKEGLIDEIVISTDDLQLPSSIAYFYSKGAGWVQKEGGSAVKYSFARCNLMTGADSVMRQIDNYEGREQRYLAMAGRGRDINVIYGTDEVPQLIYARELARKKGISSKMNIIYNSMSKNVAAYDVNNVQKLTNAACEFTGGFNGYLNKETDLYIYSYGAKTKAADTINKMRTSLGKNKNVALVELYDSTTLNNSNNELFKKLVANKNMGITQLSAYSAWNTNGNAIGLGVAHAQVYAISEHFTKNEEALAKAQTNQLLRHALEDGVYTVQTKRLLSNAGYKPTSDEREESEKLRATLDSAKVIEAFEGSTRKIKDKSYTIKNVSHDKCGFPWSRTFDCYLQVSCEATSKRNTDTK